MIKSKKNNEGFTLTEILGVIIIIGIIGIIGIASVSKYVENSRKTTFLNVAKNYIDQAKAMKANDELYHDPKNTEAVLIPLSEINVEDNDGKTAYGKIDNDNSYVIIVNEKGKYHYYITLVDETGHSLIMENVNTLDEDRIKAKGKNDNVVQSISSFRNSNSDVEIEIGGITYVVSVESKAAADENGKINTPTILLDNSVLGEFEVDWDYGWTNDDKVITVLTFNEDVEYEYYISTKSQKPLASDSAWQKNNEFVKDLGTYYVFVKNNSNEVSDYEEVIIDKIDRVKPSCSLKINGSPSSYGIYNSDYKVVFDTLTDGEESATTSGIKTRGIVVKGESLDSNNEDLNVEVSEVKTTTYLGYVVDKAGNENTCEIDVKSDGIKPTISYDLPSGLYNTSKNIVITPSDGTGEIDYYNIAIKKDGEIIKTYENLKAATYTVSLISDGDYEITTTVYDTGANSSSKKISYQIDKTPPVCTLSPSGTKSEGDYYGTDVDISFGTTKDQKETGASYESGIKSYGLNSATGVKTTKLTTDSEGTTYTGYIVDNAGNQSTCSITVKRKSSFVISYQSNEGTTCSNKNVIFNKEYGALCGTTRTGYTFVSWNTDSALTKAVTATSIFKNESKTLYAKWNANQYDVILDENGGNDVDDIKGTYDSKYSNLPTPTRSGYTFDGWFTSATGGTQVTKDTVVKITSSQTLYAHWSANSYKVSFDANGGTVSTTSKNVTFASTYGDLPVPTRESYTFDGWFTSATGGTQITKDTVVKITAEQKLYAHWTINQYTIKFNGNGNTGGTTNSVTCTFGKNCTLSTNGYTKTSYQFVGWSTSSNGSVVYSNASTVKDIATIDQTSITLYAIWVPSTTTISFKGDSDGSTGEIQKFVAPATGTYLLEVWGAQGGTAGDYTPGLGGYSKGEVHLTENQTIYIAIGGKGTPNTVTKERAGGYNGGGTAFAHRASGGGATHIAITNRGVLSNYESYKTEVLIVAGGGGGAYKSTTNEGSGGGDNGGGTSHASGGSQTAGGTAFLYGADSRELTDVYGSFGKGGRTRYVAVYPNGQNHTGDDSLGAAGGGGWYGGASGNDYWGSSNGAGGSGYIGGVSNGSTKNGVRSGHGQAKITFIG